jgi:hypothetical protein
MNIILLKVYNRVLNRVPPSFISSPDPNSNHSIFVLEAWAFKSWEKFLLNKLIKRNNKRNDIYKELQELCPSLGTEFNLLEIEKLIDDIDEQDANIASIHNRYSKIKQLAKKCISLYVKPN